MWKETKFLCSLDDLSGKRDNVMKGFLSHFLGSFWGNPKAKAAKASDKGRNGNTEVSYALFSSESLGVRSNQPGTIAYKNTSSYTIYRFFL